MKNLIATAVCLGGLICCVEQLLAATAPADSETKKQDSLRVFRRTRAVTLLQAYPGVKYRIDDERGVPRRISGKIQEGLSKGDPVQTVYEFFEKNRELYGLADPRSELKVDGVSKDELGTLVVLKQQFRNVQVWNTMLKANFGRDGNLYAIYGSTYPDIDLSTIPSIDSAQAIAITKRDLNYTAEDEREAIRFEESLESKRSPVNAWLLVAPYNNQYYLVWIIGLSRIQPYEAWEYWVDAHSGAILNKKSALMMDVEPFTPNSAPPPMPGKKDKNPVPKPRN